MTFTETSQHALCHPSDGFLPWVLAVQEEAAASCLCLSSEREPRLNHTIFLLKVLWSYCDRQKTIQTGAFHNGPVGVQTRSLSDGGRVKKIHTGSCSEIDFLCFICFYMQKKRQIENMSSGLDLLGI